MWLKNHINLKTTLELPLIRLWHATKWINTSKLDKPILPHSYFKKGFNFLKCWWLQMYISQKHSYFKKGLNFLKCWWFHSMSKVFFSCDYIYSFHNQHSCSYMWRIWWTVIHKGKYTQCRSREDRSWARVHNYICPNQERNIKHSKVSL